MGNSSLFHAISGDISSIAIYISVAIFIQAIKYVAVVFCVCERALVYLCIYTYTDIFVPYVYMCIGMHNWLYLHTYATYIFFMHYLKAENVENGYFVNMKIETRQ